MEKRKSIGKSHLGLEEKGICQTKEPEFTNLFDQYVVQKLAIFRLKKILGLRALMYDEKSQQHIGRNLRFFLGAYHSRP